ncbi:MAG: hypothetical protein AB8G95_07650 [Anaerolineae bacterium]
MTERLAGTRIVAEPRAIDNLIIPGGSVALRFAPDEIYVTPPLSGTSAVTAADPHAIIISDGAFAGAWVAEDVALALLEMHAEWEMPSERPAFAQGSVAGIATKLYFSSKQSGGKVLFVVQAPYAHELEERLA